jgi:hypothetical protein
VLKNTTPIKFALIDFELSLPCTNKSRSGTRRTLSYEAESVMFDDGSTQWGIYLLVAIVVECDITKESPRRDHVIQ